MNISDPYEPPNADRRIDTSKSAWTSVGEGIVAFVFVSGLSAIGSLLGILNRVYAWDTAHTVGAIGGGLCCGLIFGAAIAVVGSLGLSFNWRLLIWNIPEMLAIIVIVSSPFMGGRIALILASTIRRHVLA